MSSLVLWLWSQCIAEGWRELRAAAAFPWQPDKHSQQRQARGTAAKSHQHTTQHQPECLALLGSAELLLGSLHRSPGLSQAGTSSDSSWACILRVCVAKVVTVGLGEGGGQLLLLPELLLWKLLGSNWCQCLPVTGEKMPSSSTDGC